ncbi:hypothetical protein NQZ68_035635 [Dissostichus eleginoides]|nr:hypothetical protein NQZ68_035635 [Dissostichus eleginoides]
MRTPAVHALLWARCVPSERGDRGPPATPVRHDWQTAQPIGSSVVTVPAESHLKLKAQRAASNDRIESHVVVIPGCKLAYDDDSLPYVAKLGVGRVEMLIKVLIYIKSSLRQA